MMSAVCDVANGDLDTWQALMKMWIRLVEEKGKGVEERRGREGKVEFGEETLEATRAYDDVGGGESDEATTEEAPVELIAYSLWVRRSQRHYFWSLKIILWEIGMGFDEMDGIYM